MKIEKNKNLSKHQKRFKLYELIGFTLIEVLLVISIITLLSSIILSFTVTARVSARNTTRAANVSQVSKALEIYYNENNAYPSGTYFSAWDISGSSNADGSCWCQDPQTQNDLKQALVGNRILSKLPQDPAPRNSGAYLSDGNSNGFLYVSDGQNYVIGTYLERVATVVPSTNSTSTCVGAGNLQLSSGSLNPALCPAVCPPGSTLLSNNTCSIPVVRSR
jgi:prepilin-type N-terminal cleavage/methylation domain-containing protein